MLEEKLRRKIKKLSGGNNRPQLPEDQEPQAQKVVVVKNNTKPPLHALLIGIDKYQHHTQLTASCNDAKAIKNYLNKRLAVPDEQITTLLDEEATREAIITAFRNLWTDGNITRDDPILIYYSGHGGLVTLHGTHPWPEKGRQVQCIIPQDARTRVGPGSYPIPDFTLSALLGKLAGAKGNNITVIFDSCHSASGSRDNDACEVRAVEQMSLPILPPEVDSDIILGTSGFQGTSDFRGAAMDSHVFMAASSQGETAKGVRGGNGLFTTELLRVLENSNIESLTYLGCMQRFQPIRPKEGTQNPVCEGQNIHRIFFHSKVPGADTSFILVINNQTDCYLEAGTAQGITPGCTFAIHASHIIGSDNPPLGTVIVDRTEPFRAYIRIPDSVATFEIPPRAYARQTGYGDEQALNVFITDEFADNAPSDPIWADAFSGGAQGEILHLTDEESAQLVVGLNAAGKTTFTVVNQEVNSYGIAILPYVLPPEAPLVSRVLRAAARWNWHLRRTNDSHPIQKSVQLEFYKLGVSGYNKQGNGIFLPDPKGKNLNEAGKGEVHIDVRPGEYYGIKLVNEFEQDLYAYTFYFSVSDQQIAPKYLKVWGQEQVDPPLPTRSTNGGPPKKFDRNYLTIGYGSGGVLPLSHILHKDQDTDVGIYKVFLTTSPTDFSSVEQETPFDKARDEQSGTKIPAQNPPLWDTITLIVIQHRPSVSSGLGSQEEWKTVTEAALLDVPHSTPLKVQALSDEVRSISWFRTDVLTGEVLSKANHIMLRTRSQEISGSKQPPTSESVCTWFDISIIAGDGAPKVGQDDEPLVWRSHKNERGAEMGWVIGVDFDREHEIWGHLEVGDSLEVVVSAQYQGWTNDAREGQLVIW